MGEENRSMEDIKLRIVNTNESYNGDIKHDTRNSLWIISFPQYLFTDNTDGTEQLNIVIVGDLIRKRLTKNIINEFLGGLFKIPLPIFIKTEKSKITKEIIQVLSSNSNIVFEGKIDSNVFKFDETTKSYYRFVDDFINKRLETLINNLRK